MKAPLGLAPWVCPLWNVHTLAATHRMTSSSVEAADDQGKMHTHTHQTQLILSLVLDRLLCLPDHALKIVSVAIDVCLMVSHCAPPLNAVQLSGQSSFKMLLPDTAGTESGTS